MITCLQEIFNKYYCSSIFNKMGYKTKILEKNLIADAEAFGLYKAYLALQSTNDLKLSKVLEAYYKLKSNAQINDETYENRWKLFCKNIEQPLVSGNPGSYNWKPGSDPSSNWSDYNAFKDRIETFAKFWFNRHINLRAFLRYGLMGLGTPYNPSFTNANVSYIVNKFLTHCKNKFENEQNVSF